jgi:nitrite reductase/ring-hydroxylating ferredoxin subunit
MNFDWHRLGPVADFSQEEKYWFRLGTERILLLNHKQKWIAFEGLCPHAGAVLKDAEICNHQLICPYHEWVFDLEDGECLSPKQACRPLKKYALKILEGELYVELPKLSS